MLNRQRSNKRDLRRLPCPHCRGHGYQKLDTAEQAAEDPLAVTDVQILKAYWQFLALHHGPPDAVDLAEMLPLLGTTAYFTRRLKRLRQLRYIGPRGELRKVPYLSHYLDWNISLPETRELMVDDEPTITPKRSSRSWLDLIRESRPHDDEEPRDK